MALLTLDQAKADLRIDDSDHDVDVQLKLDMATGIILDYCKVAPDKWTADTVPFPVKASIVLALRSLYDDDQANPLSPAIEALLERQRDPALA